MKGRVKEHQSFTNRMATNLRTYFGLERSPTWIRMAGRDETEGVIMLGDPGTGKSQTIHHFLLQISARRPVEPVVVYDPACEFVTHHYNPVRGDVILNPLDQRSPYWSPSSELVNATDKKILTESFLPGKTDFSQSSTSGFFLKAARSILGRLFEFKPTPVDLVSWLRRAESIDMMVADTEQAHLIPRNAHGQRAGVLGVLSDLAETLRLLPDRNNCSDEIRLTQWAALRRGWIFITSTVESRDALRPLQAVYINLLMKRLMSVSPEWGQAHPCWLIVDEVHALHRLPALYEAETEGRKYGLKLIQGTQGKAQYEEYYQSLAKTMLAAPRLKLFFRCGEPESARWISDTIGENEIERPKIGTTASVEDKGRDSLNYATITEQKAVISKEQIMSLPDLHGYWKYGDVVVPFRLPLANVKKVATGYIPRIRKTETANPEIDASQAEGLNPPAIPADPKKEQLRPKAQPRQKNVPPEQRHFEYSIPQIVVDESPLKEPVNLQSDNTSEIGVVDVELEETQTDYT